MTAHLSLPAGIHVFERGWLSANNVLLVGEGPTALIDSGYCTHALQTVSLVSSVLGERPLELLANTHLHSDHCGGNAALQSRYPSLRTLTPPGHSAQVRNWDPVALSYVPTGQSCPPFRLDGVLLPGSEMLLGDLRWEIHAAPGHDPHSVVLFERASRTLISADALWENGFGVVFPELDGVDAFDEVRATLDLIESLRPQVVIPGHGSVFTSVDDALARARNRLAGFVAVPRKHARYAAKVLFKFKLLEQQVIPWPELLRWSQATAYFDQLHERWAPTASVEDWVRGLIDELVQSGAARIEGEQVINT